MQSSVELFTLPDLLRIRLLDCSSNPQPATVCGVPGTTFKPSGQTDSMVVATVIVELWVVYTPYTASYHSGVGTVADLVAVATTLFIPYINIHNPFLSSFIAEQSL